jgi:hypothetical protein
VGAARVDEETTIAGGIISIDALITPLFTASGVGGIAVEVDGPHHFFKNSAREPTGTTLFKRRLLDLAVQRGEVGRWVCVPYWEWRAGTLQERGYVRQLLKVEAPKQGA